MAALGLAVAALGLAAVIGASIVDFTVVGDRVRVDTLAWSFGLNFMGFNIIKVGIGVILIGIIVRLWIRVESVKAALPELKESAEETQVPRAPHEIRTDYGRAETTDRAPERLWIHKLAEAMWTPLFVMGPMAVAAGLILSIVQARKPIGSGDSAILAPLLRVPRFSARR